MKFRISRLKFGISSLSDIRFLLKAWDKYLIKEGQEGTESVMVYVMVEDRLPGDEVSLNFTATQEVLDRFLSILEKDGFKFSRTEIIPGFFNMCRVEQTGGAKNHQD